MTKSVITMTLNIKDSEEPFFYYGEINKENEAYGMGFYFQFKEHIQTVINVVTGIDGKFTGYGNYIDYFKPDKSFTEFEGRLEKL